MIKLKLGGYRSDKRCRCCRDVIPSYTTCYSTGKREPLCSECGRASKAVKEPGYSIFGKLLGFLGGHGEN
jgi:hypothetical protein